jgi:hypothetical protein
VDSDDESRSSSPSWSLDLVASILSVGAIVLIREVQLDNCHRDNTLRAANVQLWEGVILQAQQNTANPPDPKQVQGFEDLLHQNFAPHAC